jgi:hypothetical protein
MTNSATVPVSVTPEAAARIDAMGLQTHVERMIDHACKVLPELQRIEVVLYDRYEQGNEPGVAIDVHSKQPFDPATRIDEQLTRWVVKEFPPQVLEHLLLDYHPGEAHAG